ncbi:hypothetical protein [Spirillospora sp. CA-294931]|uniref:hypothetical protein n=1 Tax=Spirillospora sp. CA-294931 TaxID=3240042 RepID=UPI003D8B4B3C
MSTPIGVGGLSTRHMGPMPRLFGLMKATATFLAVAILLQGFSAGRLLAGEEDGRKAHEALALVIVVALLVQIVAAIVVLRGGGPKGFLVTGLVLLALTVAQVALGQNGEIAAHVPLGVAVSCAVAILAYKAWTWRPAQR